MGKPSKAKRMASGIVLTLVVSMLLACASGCKSTPAKVTVDLTKDAVKPTTISLMMDTDMLLKPEDAQQKILDEMKKETGITFTCKQPSHNQYQEKLGLLLASNDVPDVVEVVGNNYVSYATNGALYDMTSLVENSAVYKAMDQAQININKVKGKIYGVPWSKGTGTVTYMRQDWLDKLNLKVPTTYDELINVLKAFVNNDPDGDGKADTYGVDAAGLIYGDSKQPTDAGIYLPEFYQGATPDFRIVNGKWVDGFTQADTKQAFQRLAQAYKDNLIDKEIVTTDTTTARNKWNSGKYGMFNYWAGTWVGTSEDALKKTVPTGKLVVLNPIKGVSYIERNPLTISISKQCTNPKGVFKYFMEYIHDGKVDGGTMLFAHGVNGVHYSLNSGVYTPNTSLSAPSTKYYKATVEPGANLEPKFVDPMVPDSRNAASMALFYKNAKIETPFPSSPTYAMKGTDLTTLRNTAINNIVLKGANIDTELATYKAATSTYVTQILKDYNAGGIASTSSASGASSTASTTSSK